MPDKIAQIGRQAALAAGAVMRQNYTKPHEITMKGAIDPVTETDFQCQEIIIGMIRQAFPDHGFLAEETAGEGDGGQPPSAVPEIIHPGLAWEADSPPGCRWIIDPLDGTVNFAHGYPAFCVSIACEADGVLEYGVIYDPLRDELFEASRGRGPSLNGQPIRVSATAGWTQPSSPRVFPMISGNGCPRPWPAWAACWQIAQGLRRGGSAALDMATSPAAAWTASSRKTSSPGTPPRASSSSPQPGGRPPPSTAKTMTSTRLTS